MALASLPTNSSATITHELLDVRELHVTYVDAKKNSVFALRNVSFQVQAGEIVGILGESGCGKSTLALAIMSMLPRNAVVAGTIEFRREDLRAIPESRYRRLRGAKIALISQDPSRSLSPFLSAGRQIEEVLRAHGHMKATRRDRCHGMLRDVQFADVERIYNAYPHQLSGGELHRVAIAQALSCKPELLICDETTRSLDGTLQKQILDLLMKANRQFGTALIFITHNPALLAGFADRVFVMRAGRIVEQGRFTQVVWQPKHPYTKGLVELALATEEPVNQTRKRLPVIEEFDEETASVQRAD